MITQALWVRLALAVHRLTHRHVDVTSEGVGQFTVCKLRATGRTATIMFRPAMFAAGWHVVPFTEGEELLKLMVMADSPQAALEALVKAAA